MRNLPGILGLGFLALVVAVWLAPKFRVARPAQGSLEVLCDGLELRDGLLYQRGAAEPFTGVMIERYPNGAMRSRSEVVAGRLEGVSEGWYPDGRLQVREHFRAGVSHGVRTKWFPNGRKQSEAHIVQGRLHGTFRRWHPNGMLAEEVEMRDGQPEGEARSWYPSGFLRSRVRLRAGEVVEQQTWPDGVCREERGALDPEGGGAS